MLPQTEAVMITNSRNDLGKILKQRRVTIPLTLKELAHAAGVSPSHMGRVEKGTRFSSARILRKIARPLRLGEQELFTLADYLSPQTSAGVERSNGGQLDPYVATVLSQGPAEVQRAAIIILSVLKSMARGVAESKGGQTSS